MIVNKIIIGNMSTVLSESFFNAIERKGDCLDSISQLIKQGIDINTTFKAMINGKETTQSLLSYACYQNCTKIAKVLIDRGANVNYQTIPDEDTPMHIACRKHNKEIVSYLLNIPSVNLNSLNKDNELCFSIALKTSQTEIYSLIVNVINAQKSKVKHEHNGLNMKDIRKSFKNNKGRDKIEIPFLFQNIDIACANSLNGIISNIIEIHNTTLELSETPSLIIDMDSLEKSEMINNENIALKERVSVLEKELFGLANEVLIDPL